MIDSTMQVNGELHHTLLAFFSKHTRFAVASDETLIHSYAPADHVFFLEEGIVKLTTVTSKGQELCLNLFKPGSFFPLMEALADLPNQYAFTAVFPCSGWKAPAAAVKEFLQTHPAENYDLTVRLLRGLHGTLLKTEKLMQHDARALLIQTLQTLSQRFPTRITGPQTIDLPLTHQQLAELTGLSRETVTRELAKLKKSGDISITKRKITLEKM